jgi:hypothetical protein
MAQMYLADQITFHSSCDTITSECISLNEAISRFCQIVRRVVDQQQVTTDFMTTIDDILTPGNAVAARFDDVRNQYGTLNQDVIDQSLGFAVGLFCLVFPSYILIGLYLSRPLRRIYDMILRIRYFFSQ